MSKEIEPERIARIYREWHGGQALPRYERLRPEILQQFAARARVHATLFGKTVGRDLGALEVLDVGCGTGAFLRQLIDWGADPARLTGSELLPDRLDLARRNSAPGVRWHLGELDDFPDASFDLVTAHTVFSSILADTDRRALAAAMWRVTRPGGWCMMFDLRYNNPRNLNVRKVSRLELAHLWPANESHYRSLLLAPPLARRLAALPYLVSETLAALAPPLRSHFVFMASKGDFCSCC